MFTHHHDHNGYEGATYVTLKEKRHVTCLIYVFNYSFRHMERIDYGTCRSKHSVFNTKKT